MKKILILLSIFGSCALNGMYTLNPERVGQVLAAIHKNRSFDEFQKDMAERLAGCEVNQPYFSKTLPVEPYEYRTPLEYSLELGRTDYAKKLIEWHADVNHKNTETGDTPLNFIVKTEIHIVDPNERHLAVKLLIDNGADLLLPDKNGKTPLMIAREANNREKTIKVLEEAENQFRLKNSN